MDGRVTVTGPVGATIFVLVIATLIGTIWLVVTARRRAANSRLSRVALWVLVAALLSNAAATLLSTPVLAWAVIPLQVVAAVCAALALRRQREVSEHAAAG